MYSLTVREHIMIAHSFRGEVFGPARKLHGATYVVDVTFQRRTLDADGLVVDIGRAGELVRQTLAPLNYCNLDEVPEFEGQNTTTEFMAHAIHGKLAKAIADGVLGDSGRGIERLAVRLGESHLAWAAFEDDLAP